MTFSNNDDRLYGIYHNDVGRYTLLTAEEEKDLFLRYHTCPHCGTPIPHKVERLNCPDCGCRSFTDVNPRIASCTNCSSKFEKFYVPKTCRECGSGRDTEAREKIVVSNLRFVIKRAKKLTSDMTRRRLLISAGNVGLLLSVDKYDPNHGTRFLTYAEWWIRKEMYDAINNSPLVHIPPQKRRAILKELKEGKYLCIHCGLKTNNIYAESNGPCVCSRHEFEDPSTGSSSLLGNGVSLETTLTSLEDSLEKDTIDSDMQETLRDVINTMQLSERDKYIIMGYYDVAHDDRKTGPKNLNQLSSVLGITPERVRQLKKHIMVNVRKALRRRDIGNSADIAI